MFSLVSLLKYQLVVQVPSEYFSLPQVLPDSFSRNAKTGFLNLIIEFVIIVNQMIHLFHKVVVFKRVWTYISSLDPYFHNVDRDPQK